MVCGIGQGLLESYRPYNSERVDTSFDKIYPNM